MIVLSPRSAAVFLLAVVPVSGCSTASRQAPQVSPDRTASDVAAAPSAAPTVVQAGAPGAPSRVMAAGDLVAPRSVHASEDVRFMQDMIHHHAQAVVMTGLVAERTGNEAIRLLARRIDVSQADEIALMRRWLSTRDAPADGEHAHHQMAPAHGTAHGAASRMPGMLTDEQMARLAASRDGEFDRLFLEYMIEHHEGALQMVRDLFASERGGQEVEIFDFASHVDADQRMEIERMRRLLASLPDA